MIGRGLEELRSTQRSRRADRSSDDSDWVCCVVDRVARSMTFVAVGSDRLSELIERGSHPELSVDHVNAEFVVAAPQVLDERVPADHDAGRPIGLQAAHRSQPGLQSSVVPLDPLGPTPEGRIIHRKIFSCFRDQTGAERFATVRSHSDNPDT